MNGQRKLMAVTRAVFLLALTAVVAGCGGKHVLVDMNKDYTLEPGTKIQVGPVTNNTGRTFKMDICKKLEEKLTDKLRDKGLLATSGDQPTVLLVSMIVDYEKGNAFKRWLAPGWGSTVLYIDCDLTKDSQPVGRVRGLRTVTFGGGYSIFAWSWVFGSLADETAEHLSGRFR